MKPEDDQDLTQIAFEHNISRNAIVTHPPNRDLFLVRDGHVLHADDDLELPAVEKKWVSLRTAASHTFVYTPLRRELRLKLMDENNTPQVVDYTLRVDGEEFVGVSENGGIYAEVSVEAKVATLETVGRTRTFAIGKLTPVTTTTGLKARLVNLGYLKCATIDDTLDGATHDAIRNFQHASGLPTSGTADPPTRAKLRRAAGI